jgi:hypothetical protein
MFVAGGCDGNLPRASSLCRWRLVLVVASTSKDKTIPGTRSTSNRSNTQLGQTDFPLDVKEGAKRLVTANRETAVDGDERAAVEKQNKESLLKAGTRLEVAIADEPGKRRTKRPSY